MSDLGLGNNRGSVFDPIVSVEAWRTSCNAEQAGAVHVDITFLEALLGDEPDSKVRFHAALKRAVVKVYVSKTDPIKVIRSSVDRGNIVKTEHEKLQTTQSKYSASGAASIGLTPDAVKLDVSAGGGLSGEKSETFKTSEVIGDKNITQYHQDDMYCWEVTSRNNEFLNGKIWDAANEPRLQTILTNARAISSDCEVRAVIECRRQDIEIRNIHLKERKLSIAAFREAKNNNVVAEAVLKQLIYEKGFVVENFSEPFAPICITSISVPEE